MSTLSRQALWLRLRNNGLVEGDVPPVEKTDSPWYVRVMLGAAGWIGSLFLLGFVGVGFSFVMQSAMASLVVGVLVCGGAFALFRSNRDNDFISQGGLAISLVGQILLIYGLHELLRRDESLLYGSVFVVEVVLTILMPSYICRVITSLTATIALSFALDSAGIHGIAAGITAAGFALVWTQDIRLARFSAIFRPVGYGLALSLLLFYRASFPWEPFSHNSANWISIHAPWLGKTLVLAVFLAVVFLLLNRAHIAAASRSGSATLCAATLVMAASFPAPGIAQALLILIIGFSVYNRALIGLGLLAFGGFLSNYYYMMQSTLLVKSMLLLGLGALLLVGRLVMRLWLPAEAVGGKIDG